MSSVAVAGPNSVGHTLSEHEYRDTGRTESLDRRSLLYGYGVEYSDSDLEVLSGTPIYGYEYEKELLETRRRIEELLSLRRPNWDSYGALPVSREAINRAGQIVLLLAEEQLPLPRLFPLPDGGVRLEWMTKHYEISVDVNATDSPRIYWCDSLREREWEGPVAEGVREFGDVVSRMKQEMERGEE